MLSPSQSVMCLGFVWDSKYCTLLLTEHHIRMVQFELAVALWALNFAAHVDKMGCSQGPSIVWFLMQGAFQALVGLF